jgi:hypothetical protein
MHAFPNGWYDGSQRIVGLWFISRNSHARFSSLYYTLHAMPARDLRNPRSIVNLPLRVDGKPVGSQPIALSAGRHEVVSADRQLKITSLEVSPVNLPRTQPFSMSWQRGSPTALKITARSTANPFLLVFGEAYHPEWQATLNGSQPLSHVIVDGVMNGWLVPALPEGGEIALRFGAQRYYIMAALISLVALIVMIVLACAPRLWPLRGADR